jgi:hypothetical protein
MLPGTDIYMLVDDRDGDGTVYLEEKVTFSASALDIDLLIEDSDEALTYTWEFGDDTKASSGVDLTEVDHAYDMDGVTYTVELTVTDSGGETITTSHDVKVTIAEDQDTDGDGMEDLWEMENGLDRFTDDANDDKDGDGYSNYQEYLDGTEPDDPGSFWIPSDSGGGDTEDKEGDSDDDSGLMLILALVIAVIVVVVLVVLLLFLRKRAAAKVATAGAAVYDPYGADAGSWEHSGAGAASTPTTMGDPSGPPPISGAGGGPDASLGAGPATTDPSLQLPPGKPKAKDMDEGSEDPLEPLSPEVAKKKPAPGSNTCPSCGAGVQAGWFICPKCKNPLS